MSDLENFHRQALETEQAATRMYREAWKRELQPSGYLNKSHLIDCLVLTTKLVVKEALRFRAIVKGVERWRYDVVNARMIGIAEPSLWDYIPEDLVKPIERSQL